MTYHSTQNVQSNSQHLLCSFVLWAIRYYLHVLIYLFQNFFEYGSIVSSFLILVLFHHCKWAFFVRFHLLLLKLWKTKNHSRIWKFIFSAASYPKWNNVRNNGFQRFLLIFLVFAWWPNNKLSRIKCSEFEISFFFFLICFLQTIWFHSYSIAAMEMNSSSYKLYLMSKNMLFLLLFSFLHSFTTYNSGGGGGLDK